MKHNNHPIFTQWLRLIFVIIINQRICGLYNPVTLLGIILQQEIIPPCKGRLILPGYGKDRIRRVIRCKYTDILGIAHIIVITIGSGQVSLRGILLVPIYAGGIDLRVNVELCILQCTGLESLGVATLEEALIFKIRNSGAFVENHICLSLQGVYRESILRRQTNYCVFHTSAGYCNGIPSQLFHLVLIIRHRYNQISIPFAHPQLRRLHEVGFPLVKKRIYRQRKDQIRLDGPQLIRTRLYKGCYLLLLEVHKGFCLITAFFSIRRIKSPLFFKCIYGVIIESVVFRCSFLRIADIV